MTNTAERWLLYFAVLIFAFAAGPHGNSLAVLFVTPALVLLAILPAAKTEKTK